MGAPRPGRSLGRVFRPADAGRGIGAVRHHRARRFVQEVSFLSQTRLHAAVPAFPKGGEAKRFGNGVEHRWFAEALPGDLSQSQDRATGRATWRADHVWVGRARAGRSGHELRGCGEAGPERGLPPMLPLHPTPPRGRFLLKEKAFLRIAQTRARTKLRRNLIKPRVNEP